MWNKKGITPLMATILIISFAVALGVGVMSLGKAQVEESAQCPLTLGMHFLVLGEKEDLCLDAESKQLKFTLENGANAKVEGVIVNIIGKQKAETFELKDAKMALAGTYVGSAPYDSAISGDIRQVKVTPVILLQEEQQICPDEAAVMEEVEEC